MPPITSFFSKKTSRPEDEPGASPKKAKTGAAAGPSDANSLKQTKTDADAGPSDAKSPKKPKTGAADDGTILASLPPAAAALLAPLAGTSWLAALEKDVRKPYFAELAAAVATERAKKKVFPPEASVLGAFTHAPLEDVRVVILGQDPYHGDGQAHGLCFSVQHGVAVPPSLRNMYTELEADIAGFKRPAHGNLEAWASQGVFMLNATLTVRAHEANSHAKLAVRAGNTGGWQGFTDAVIRAIDERCDGVVFMLWGGFAKKKGAFISRTKHCVIEAAHPSPLSVTKWRGCKVFSQCNAYLERAGKQPINWSLPKGPR